MAGKTLLQLTALELRSECSIRGISVSGTKADLVIRLEECIREHGQNPEDVRFYPVQPVVTDLTGDTGYRSYATSTLIDTEARRSSGQPSAESFATLSGQQTPTDGQPGQSASQSIDHQGESVHTLGDDVFKTAAGQLKMLTQSMSQTNDAKSFETRLRALEESMTRFFTEMRTATTQQPPNRAVPQLPDHPSPVHVTHESYHTGRSYECNTGGAQTGASHVTAANNRPFFTRDTFRNDPGHASQYTPYDARVQERSVLIPYDDLRAARSSLPEFSGTRAEDPVRYIDNTESILAQARIHPSGWCRAVEPQLKGTASAWYIYIKVLDLTWEEFRVEFFENFNNSEIQSQLRADIVSTRQSSGQSLTEFVLIKNQLARRVNTGLSESDLVGIIAGLTRDTFRTHIRLHRPQTFSELRRIAGVLDAVTETVKTRQPTNPPPKHWTSKPNKGMDTPRTAAPDRKKFGYKSEKPPPGPCKYCGELHWHNKCPHKPSTSGNGGGVDGN